MPQAEWNGKSFEVTAKHVRALEDLKSTLKVKTKNNEDDSGSPPTQTKAFEPEQIDFNLPVSAEAGIDVRKEHNEWRTLAGDMAPLYVGGEMFGPQELQLISVKISDIMLDNLGRFHSATIGLSFKEKDNEPAGQKSSPGGDSAGSAGSGGASGSSGSSSQSAIQQRVSNADKTRRSSLAGRG